jgi:hypothetical protein
MPMDAPLPTPEAKSATVVPTPRRLWRILVACVLFACLAFFTFLVFPKRKFVWLTPAQFDQAGRPGPFTLLKFKLISLVEPLLWHHRSHPPGTLISTSVVLIPSGGTGSLLGAPFATNAVGMKAWILSPEEMSTFRKRLNTSPGFANVVPPEIKTADGVATRTVSGHSILAAPGVYTNVGITLDLTASATSISLRLLVGASYTQVPWPSHIGKPAIKTNFCTACRAVITGDSSLVINCCNNDASSPASYWLIFAQLLPYDPHKPLKH